MPPTGIELFKLLPKINCGECGVPTCLAFAMNLAAAKAELASCPRIPAETKTKLEELLAPPILPVTIGAGEKALKIGGETVLFRHEKRFEHAPGIAIVVSDMMMQDEMYARLERFNTLRYERAGEQLRPELVAIKNESRDALRLNDTIEQTIKRTDANLILISDVPDVLAAALTLYADHKPLLYAADETTADGFIALAKEYKCPVAVKADGLEKLSKLTAKFTQAGIKNLVIDSGARTVKQAFQDQVVIRTAALKKNRSLGFPTIALPFEMTHDPLEEAMIAAMFIAKYAGIIVLSDFKPELLFPLLVARMNIYTDPQRPLATKEGVYPVNNPDENSPVLVTSNFSLTYFIISGEIENSKVPAWLLVKDSEGLSVLTAWAAGKFNADNIAAFVKKSGIMDKVNHRKLIIPGYTDMELSALKEELPEWDIVIGPKEGAHIPAYLKNF